MTKPGISAQCYSDDRAVEVKFDAVPWFKQALVDEIGDLGTCGWYGDYPSDEVALWMAGKNKEIKAMFDYIEAYNKCHKEHIGFECRVDGDQALAWLRQKRPDILPLLIGLNETLDEDLEKIMKG